MFSFARLDPYIVWTRSVFISLPGYVREGRWISIFSFFIFFLRRSVDRYDRWFKRIKFENVRGRFLFLFLESNVWWMISRWVLSGGQLLLSDVRRLYCKFAIAYCNNLLLIVNVNNIVYIFSARENFCGNIAILETWNWRSDNVLKIDHTLNEANSK